MRQSTVAWEITRFFLLFGGFVAFPVYMVMPAHFDKTYSEKECFLTHY